MDENIQEGAAAPGAQEPAVNVQTESHTPTQDPSPFVEDIVTPSGLPEVQAVPEAQYDQHFQAMPGVTPAVRYDQHGQVLPAEAVHE